MDRDVTEREFLEGLRPEDRDDYFDGAVRCRFVGENSMGRSEQCLLPEGHEGAHHGMGSGQ